MGDREFSVLFLCTGNSARSILAEALINYWGQGMFKGFSAGSHPKSEVHPLAMRLLEHMNMPTAGLRSKNWDEFAESGAIEMDFVFTVCDNAAGEVCPVWPGLPMTAHWGIPDPAAVEGSETTRMLAFRRAYAQLEESIKVFVNLPFESLDRLGVQSEIDKIGRAGGPQGSTCLEEDKILT